MRISILIPTLRAQKYLTEQIQALWNQTRPPAEIVVVDSSSEDETVAMAKKLGCRTEVIPRHQFNHGATRNLAATLARGDALVFLTQDALPANEHFLENLTARLGHGVSAAYARQIPYPSALPTEVFARTFNYPSTSHDRTARDVERLGVKAFFFSNVASAIERAAFASVGGFPESTIVSEDMLLCSRLLRAGHTVRYEASAQVFHSHNYSLKLQFKRYFDIGVVFRRSPELDVVGSLRGEGLRYVGAQARHLIAGRHWSHLPRSLAESAVKLAGISMGRKEHLLPPSLKRKLSLHAFFWT
jgi:rhamnosyltransferase